jgi:hypothetical protein
MSLSFDRILRKRRDKRNWLNWLNHKNIAREYEIKLYTSFEPIVRTRPLRCNPRAGTSIHTITGHYHLFMYMAAVKSLLRFYDDMAVVAHDADGTLSDEDKDTLRHHVEGITIIDKGTADKRMKDILRPFPDCRKYRSRILNSLELLDNGLLADTDKVITMNSDVLFLKKPEELIRWIVDGKDEIVFVHEDAPCAQKEFLDEIGCDFPPHVTLALVCFHRGVINLPMIESILKRSKLARTHLWPLGQCIFPALLSDKSGEYGIHSFNKEKWAASGHFGEEDIFRHYWSSTAKLAEKHFSDFDKVLSELAQDATTDRKEDL